jgi:hypothetical protein
VPQVPFPLVFSYDKKRKLPPTDQHFLENVALFAKKIAYSVVYGHFREKL